MGIRETLNQNQNAVVVAAAVIIATAVIYIVWSSGSGRSGGFGGSEAYYMDVVTRKVFTDVNSRIPPIESPDGNPAVRVKFYTCNGRDCSKSARFIGYYEKFTDEAKRILAEPAERTGEAGDQPNGDFEQSMYFAEEEAAEGRLRAVHREGIDLQDPEIWAPVDDASAEIESRLVCDDGDRARQCIPR